MKSVFIGLIVPTFLLAIVAISTVVLLGRTSTRNALFVALALLLVSAVTWQPVAMRMSGVVSIMHAKELTRITKEVADAIAKVPDLEHRHLYFPVTSQYVNRENLDYELRLRGLPVPRTPILYFETDLTVHAAELDRSDLAVLFSDDSTLPLDWTLSTGMRKQIGAAVAATGAFETIATISGGELGGQIFVMKRKQPLASK